MHLLAHLHDHDEPPMPHGELARIDELLAKVRWRCRNDPWYLADDDG